MLELGVGTGKWDAGLKKAKQSLDNFTQANGGLQQALEKESQKMQKFVQMMGQMDSTAKTAKGQMNDYKATIEQLTMQYNRMSEAQKKTIGQDYLNSIEQIKEKFRQAKTEIEGINKSLGDMKMPDVKGGGLFAGLGDKMSGALQVFVGNMLTKAAGAVANLGSEMYGMVQQGVELARQGEGIRNAFERLGRGDILQGLRDATHGTVTDIELMKAAVKFNDFKLPLDELGTMLAFAQQKAKDTGQSVDYMVDSIVTGLGRKSLMILDNLGLSATEVKERMAETGDMTKAVGAIIREQMAKAGDYVETAADRAAQANVSLQNKMEELGRKFAPLQEASDNMWTSMKIGIMDVIGGPLTDLLNKLTEAGRLASAYGVLGGNAKVGRMTANLSSAREGNRQSIYQQQQQQFWRYINPREQQIKDIRAWQSGQRGEALQGRINSITEKYGSLDATKIQAEVDAAKKMLADYQKAAKQILQPIKQEITPTITTSGGGKSGKVSTVKPEEILPVGSVAALNKELSELQKQQSLATDTESWNKYQEQIDAVKTTIAGIKGELVNIDLKAIQPASILSEKIGKSIDPIQIDFSTGNAKKQSKEMSKDWSAAANAIQAVGSAMSQIEDPAAKVVGTIAQAIASIALGFAQATAADSKLGVFGWIAAVTGGLATMISTISAIHSATGYANGGVVHAAGGAAIPGTFVVPGTTYSGDQIPAMLNAGEVVLTRAQAGIVSNALEGGGWQALQLSATISGEDIRLALNNNGRRTGRGEYVTTRFR